MQVESTNEKKMPFTKYKIRPDEETMQEHTLVIYYYWQYTSKPDREIYKKITDFQKVNLKVVFIHFLLFCAISDIFANSPNFYIFFIEIPIFFKFSNEQ